MNVYFDMSTPPQVLPFAKEALTLLIKYCRGVFDNLTYILIEKTDLHTKFQEHLYWVD